MITPIITTTLKYPAAVGEARMLQSPREAASPGRDAMTGVPPCSEFS
ncbi:hypothetical protein Natpe_4408 (plasmid) [Natrinema pellirubrum DSM 15624]|uniref:Uncharacterized protein n=1 Tax=Natrinema pellirubrum (strain DSM 15624 / CIP 106293 / JCM 10476 / NCIMB 786 / 157) TaxID=797303 RepID=L0JRE8_NATP1|nr:hypothetical protein Natpe_4408 [Natrinema pellirubrum DSM 15624]